MVVSQVHPAEAGAVPLAPGAAAAEANHRIANNLSLVAGMVRMHARNISRAAEALDNDQVCALLDEIGSRIDGIARLHAMLAAGTAWSAPNAR